MATSDDSSKEKYDIVLFGVTGFTGKLAAEFLLSKEKIRWAASARNVAKAETVLQGIASRCQKSTPPLLEADLVATSDDQVEKLRDVVRQAKVVLTCAGPFDVYGRTLVQVCAELGVDYADVTGETDFFRSMIQEHDSTARKTGATIVCHCGNDCIPFDLMVHELHQYAVQKKNTTLQKVQTFAEFSAGSAFSGGTLATAVYHIKNKDPKSRTEFDPLLMDETLQKSEYRLKNISPKKKTYVPELGKSVAQWLMSPVMVNCVRRSNALLHYAKDLEYGDAQVQFPVLSAAWWNGIRQTVVASSAALAPGVLGSLVPKPGEGPDREVMESGSLTVYAYAVLQDQTRLQGKFYFGKDVGYLYTAAMLVETGMLLLERETPSGVVTPAVALGSELTKQLQNELEVTLDIQEVSTGDAPRPKESAEE